ncbi:MAG: amino acid adenylation domain-containing protein, partial [bacterium]|nr:amino acid adenylation domain-containing protein [bacterium]
IFGGEALKPLKLKEWRQRYPGVKLINMYGITETTVHVTFKEIGEDEIERNVSNIGSAIPTLTLYVLDKRQNLLPLNVPGELAVGGDGVGRGYLNRPLLTGTKFVPNPFKEGDRLYLTGDLARWQPDGNIEYLGRIDQQVKIRGFRIELGEIENRLLQHPRVKEAVVTANEEKNGGKYLCAYIVFKTTDPLEAAQLREHLARHIPAYMIPSFFVPMQKIPLTTNGKTDRKSLPAPQIHQEHTDCAPSNHIEKT